jgi:hypothetical protein
LQPFVDCKKHGSKHPFDPIVPPHGPAVDEVEQWRVLNTFVSELTRTRGTGRVARTALRQRERRRERRGVQPQPSVDRPDLVVCPSGNLALVYFPDIDGRATLEQLNERFPDMVGALANHPGVGLLLVRSAELGALAIGPTGVLHLADGKVEGEDPVAPYGKHAAAALPV